MVIEDPPGDDDQAYETQADEKNPPANNQRGKQVIKKS
jgi:hypothetical protein